MATRHPMDLEMSSIVMTKDRDPGDLTGLMASIKENGILQPIVVAKNGEGKFKIVEGRRRFQVAEHLKFSVIPAYVVDISGDADQFDAKLHELATEANVHRKELTPIEVSDRIVAKMQALELPLPDIKGVQLIEEDVLDQLCQDFEVTDHMALLRLANLRLLSKPVRQLVHDGKLAADGALLTVGLAEKELNVLLKRIEKTKGHITMSRLKEMIQTDRNELGALLEDPECQTCQFRGRQHPELFGVDIVNPDEDEEESYYWAQLCYNTKCFHVKSSFIEKAAAKFIKESGIKAGISSILSTKQLKHQQIVDYNEENIKKIDGCKDCSNGGLLMETDPETGQPKFRAVCQAFCGNLKTKATKEAKPAKNSRKNATEDEDEVQKLQATEDDTRKVEGKLLLSARRLAVERFIKRRDEMVAQGSKYGPFDSLERCLVFVMHDTNPVHLANKFIMEDFQDQDSDTQASKECEANRILVEADLEAVARYCSKNACEMFQRRVDFAGVTATRIDFMWQLATGESGFIANNKDQIYQMLSKNMAERMKVLTEAGWRPSWEKDDK